MINKFKALINKVILKEEESKVECAIDEELWTVTKWTILLLSVCLLLLI